VDTPIDRLVDGVAGIADRNAVTGAVEEREGEEVAVECAIMDTVEGAEPMVQGRRRLRAECGRRDRRRRIARKSAIRTWTLRRTST
jgi:hypothetical protein